ncbi:2-amino-4-hydroxy-6-hydroxymethyldihydropteridine diphosphokinase [uncultured Tateyamaria sp.]|uniref:2-amino-4-hydroxy-6- hydroxymethyldihydropteridine diphosphokinase n=1 Tax=uncultured Tateyamaria sp. TaxID=455651 RepID=UPI00263759F9|nr:2-amino-4-hydroxy-6-hydroxymethyldihydropteridine diphosphokinase [uncultured Tateyamaria sp.]
MLIALGSNMSSDVGSPKEVLLKAVREIAQAGALIRAKSALFSTPAFPAGSGPDFVNAAISIDASWAPAEAIAVLHGIEAKLGRRRDVRWGQRIIDLDLLSHGALIRPDVATLRHWMSLPLDEQREKAPGQLILPHPRMHERAFVLVPLAEVAPDWVHPITRRTVLQMRDALPQDDLDAITALQ